MARTLMIASCISGILLLAACAAPAPTSGPGQTSARPEARPQVLAAPSNTGNAY